MALLSTIEPAACNKIKTLMFSKNQVVTFYDSIASIYDLIIKDKWDIIGGNNDKYWLIKYLEKHEISTILDCGCGTGVDAVSLSKAGYSCVGCDISKQMLRRANDNANKYDAKNNCAFVNCDITKLSRHFRTAQFDAVTCMGNVLMHLSGGDQIIKALSEMNFVLKPGGRCFIALDDNYDWVENLLGTKRVIFHIEAFCPSGQFMIPIHIWPVESEVVRSQVIFIYIGKDREWTITKFYLPLRLIFLKQLLSMMKKAGFTDLKASYVKNGQLNHDITKYWITSTGIRKQTQILIEGKK